MNKNKENLSKKLKGGGPCRRIVSTALGAGESGQQALQRPNQVISGDLSEPRHSQGLSL